MFVSLYGRGSRKLMCQLGGKVDIPGVGEIKVVTQGKYLGVMIGAKQTAVNEDISRRVRQAGSAMGRLGKIWRMEGLSLARKVQLYLALVRSVLLYAGEVFVYSVSQLQRLEALQSRHLRLIAKSTAHMTRESNEDLRSRLGVPSIESYLAWKRLGWWRKLLNSTELVTTRASILGKMEDETGFPTPSTSSTLRQLSLDLTRLVGCMDWQEGGAQMCRYKNGDVRIDMQSLNFLADLPKAQLRVVTEFVSRVERRNLVKAGPRPEPTHECEVCGTKWGTYASLMTHQSSAHGKRDPWRALVEENKCKLCGKIFATKRNAQLHVQRVCKFKHPNALAEGDGGENRDA